MNSFLLSNIIKKVKSSQTLIMAEKAKKLKQLGYNVRNLSIGEPDFSTQNFVLRAATKAIDEVILHAQYWVSSMVKFCNAKPIILSYNIALFKTPCNTTGFDNVSYLEELQVIVNILKNKKNIIILSYDEKTVTLSVKSILLSKSFSLTGLSIGYMGDAEWFSKACVKIKCKNYIAHKAAISVVETSTKTFIKKIVKKFREKRKLLIKLLKEFGVPDGATYFFKKKFNTKVSISTVSGSAFATSKKNIL
ncbi:hypothetical protein ONB78_00185 [Candidatus Karelsulcia muelleri]|uniref:hypothetical protein n=1 Tax=Candidatus Karelsulcia muelleri TaxID=336810 RepID=UPI00236384C0|nr:hypothetical protein [Candidatus Karelsulcia muelleri]WDE42234.1 hypothetical protein ONB78_00185 [Candidatus Karelsulcia muelleri]